jgi:hypothetical protein
MQFGTAIRANGGVTGPSHPSWLASSIANHRSGCMLSQHWSSRASHPKTSCIPDKRCGTLCNRASAAQVLAGQALEPPTVRQRSGSLLDHAGPRPKRSQRRPQFLDSCSPASARSLTSPHLSGRSKMLAPGRSLRQTNRSVWLTSQFFQMTFGVSRLTDESYGGGKSVILLHETK